MNLTQEFQRIMNALEQRERAAEQRERELAKAAEALTQTDAAQAAFSCGRQQTIGRVVALIDLQLEQLGSAGLNAISLRTLRRNLMTDFYGANDES